MARALGDDCNGGLMVVAALAREMKALGDDCNGGLMVVADGCSRSAWRER